MNFPYSHFDPGVSLPSKPNVINQLWRRRRVFGLTFGLTLIASIAVIALLPTVYYAYGTVAIGNQEPASSGASGAWIEKLGDPADLESQLLIVSSHRMLRLALARPGVAEAVKQECSHGAGWGGSARCAKLETGSKQILEHVDGRYTVRAVGRSRIISIGYQSSVPEVASTLANALLITYLEDQRGENARGREAASSWILGESKEFASSSPLHKFYQDLYGKVNDLESERRMLFSSGRLVSLAELPSVPHFPKKMPLLAAALTLATILAGVAALARDVTDGRVRGAKELAALVKAPVLAIFPSAGSEGAGRRSRVSLLLEGTISFLKQHWLLGGAISFPRARWPKKPRPKGEAVDAGQILYARLSFLGHCGHGKRILIASERDGEDKTAVTMSLAGAAARSGRKVLVLDLDFEGERRAHIAAPSVGLSGVAQGQQIEIEQLVRRTTVPGVDLAKPDADAAALLVGGRLSKLMSSLDDYDLVLIDGPSGYSLHQVEFMGQHLDGIVWCAAWGVTLCRDVEAAMEELREQQLTVMGVVITKADLAELKLYDNPCRMSRHVRGV
jgi:Mrp family chromosome partitioning ATPase